MIAWEIQMWLERSWAELKTKEKLEAATYEKMRLLSWQPDQEKWAALKRIVENRNSSQQFIEHAERMLRISIKYQRSLELWK